MSAERCRRWASGLDGSSGGYVSRLLGHASPAITLGTYAQACAAAEHDAVTRERDGRAPRRGPSVSGLSAAQPALRVKMLAWSAELEIAKNGKKLVPSVPSPS
jgi:hypothetical protein